jgi:hypothetical protein
MSLKIEEASDKGHPDKEYLMLIVTENCNLRDFAVHDNTYVNGKVSNELEHFYQFPNKQVKARDTIVLLTREKRDGDITKDVTGGSTIYYFYWGLGHTVWNKELDWAYVLRISIVDDEPV